MDRLKQYSNLYEIYQKPQKRKLTTLIAALVVWILSFILAGVLGDSSLLAIFAILGMIGFITSLVFGVTYLVLCHTAKKSISRFTDEELERIDAELPLADNLDGFGATGDAVFNIKGNLFLYPVRDILWIYRQVTTTRSYGVAVSKQTAVVIAGRDKKRYSQNIKNKNNTVEFLQQKLYAYRKGIFFGYSPDLNTMFTKNLDRMIQISEDADRQQ